MAAFAERFGFVFRAHEMGDANRSARVERPFHFIENNFLAGRDLRRLGRPQPPGARLVRQGQRARTSATCTPCPRELFAAERPHLKPLPALRPRGLPAAPAHRRRARATSALARQPLLGALAADRPAASRCARPRTGSRSTTARACVASHAPWRQAARASASPPGAPPAARRAGRATQPPPEETGPSRGAPEPLRRTSARAQAARAGTRHARPAPAAAPAARLPARRRCLSAVATAAALRPLRPRPARAHGPAHDRHDYFVLPDDDDTGDAR